ncbi:MAG: 3,4-dihydroxy-2-butanone-4-phosphate synthase [Rhodospirillaceae bacterium]|jgi:3,4-dihydroxy 2-butanone 4-phosphate synthase / GTP cyclohydrolase II|nr:3,4-dihydroxy-2-butanone-4-phosphate synthase [Rhodospirillaceae bacterium]MBT5753124.1 3,4-dihydroxy-2-butanone-4-phosphate synthase [Rhodospirillaceae bacterium]
MSDKDYLSKIEEVIDEARAGRMFILVDDEDRENEGDLVIPADMADAQSVNFMAKHGRGLICLSITSGRVNKLGLALMSTENASRHQTAFTVSIEAREGVTTGISAADRARTISAAIDPSSVPGDIVSPGHVFPLVARDGGVLVRAGHTEAAVDIARLAGRDPSGVICEIMNDDGTMARLPDLVTFAKAHDLKIATIADLIAYRRRTEKVVDPVLETRFNSIHGGDFRMIVYVNRVAYAEHIALVKGDITTSDPVLVRMHGLNVLEDVLGDSHSGHGGALQSAMRMIGEEGRGVVVLIREPRPTSLLERLKVQAGEGSENSGDKNDQPAVQLRDYGVGAQILLDLGIKDMILLSNTRRTIIGLDGYGLSVVEQRPLEAGDDEENQGG